MTSETKVAALLAFAKDIATNYDHEGRDSCNLGCRVCQAQIVLCEVLGDRWDDFLRGEYVPQ